VGILRRFKDIMASNVNAVIHRDEKNPEKAIEKYLNQLRADLGQVKAETAALQAEYNRAERAFFDNQSEKEKMQRYISKAQESGDMSSVRIYENKLAAIETEGVRLNEKYVSTKQDMDNLKAMNEKLSTDAETLEGKLSEIKAKMSAAEAMQSMNKIASKAGAANSDEMFNRMNEKADYMMDRANAMAELDGAQQKRELSELEELESKYNNDGPIDLF
jgi:phage shock protein A